MENTNRLTQDEYEYQFYDFSTTELIERFRRFVTKSIQKVLIDLEEETGKTKRYTEESMKSILPNQINELYGIYMESAKIALAKFEEESRRIFAIPQHILLEEYKFKSEQISDEDVENLKKEISNLEQELIREKVFLAKCKQMKETYERDIEPIYKKLSKILTIAKRSLKKEPEHQKLVELYNTKVQQYRGNTVSSLPIADVDFFKTDNKQ